MAYSLPMTWAALVALVQNAMQKGVDYVSAGRLGGSTAGNYSTAEGYETTASAPATHAEGVTTQATVEGAHAEGGETVASATFAHAEGYKSTASGYASHAENGQTTASGTNSHASGTWTIANHKSQAVFGEFNTADPSTAAATARGNYALIVGNGTADNARSNAMSVDWDGVITMGGLPKSDMDAVPKKWLDASFITETASGSIASFSDGADNIPVKDLTAQIVPVQDLHGYSSPYPAGGGANIWDEQGNDGAYWSDGGVLTSLAGNSCTGKIPVVQNTTYYVTAGVSVARTVKFFDGNMSLLSKQDVNQNAGASITAPSGAEWLVINVGTGTLPSGWGVNYPSSVTTYSPYSNVCPISGWSGAKIYRTGINVWDEDWEVGSLNTTTGADAPDNTKIRSKNYIPMVGGESYRFVAPQGFVLCGYDRAQNYISEITATDSVFTLPANCAFVRFRMATQYGTTYNHDISINYPSTDTTYHAYTGTVYPVSWQDEAGTVYGGTLTYIGGGKWKLQATKKKDTFTWADGTSATVVSDYTRKNFALTSTALTANGITSNIAPFMQGQASNPVPHTDFSTSVVARVYLPTSTDSTTSIDLCYTFATLPAPVILDGDDVATLLGANNIWADCGDVEVTYRADTKLYIDAR